MNYTENLSVKSIQQERQKKSQKAAHTVFAADCTQVLLSLVLVVFIYLTWLVIKTVASQTK